MNKDNFIITEKICLNVKMRLTNFKESYLLMHQNSITTIMMKKVCTHVNLLSIINRNKKLHFINKTK